MKFIGLASLIFVALGPLAALADTVSYDQTYDVGSNSLDIVACSDGPNGLETLGFTTFNSLPDFPFIGGVGAVAGYDSANCGTCWQLTYTNSSGIAKSINILAIDHAAPGTFNIALEAMNALTNNQAVFDGRVTVTSEQVAKSACGLSV